MSDLLNQKLSPEEMEGARQTLVDLRRRVARNEAVPPEELAEGLRLLRKAYGKEAQAAFAKKKTTKKAKAAPKSKAKADDVLGDILGGL